MSASKHNYQCFLILVQSLSACTHFQESLHLALIGYFVLAIAFSSIFDWLRPAVPFFLKLHSLSLCKGKSYQVFWLGEGQK